MSKSSSKTAAYLTSIAGPNLSDFEKQTLRHKIITEDKEQMFTYGTKGHKWIFPRVNGLVIWPVAPHMRSAVDQPGCIEHHGEPQKSRNKITHSQGLPPEVPGYDCGNDEAEQHYRKLVVPKGKQQDNVRSHKVSRSHIYSSDCTALMYTVHLWPQLLLLKKRPFCWQGLHKQNLKFLSPPLKHHHWIRPQISQVQLPALFNDVGMFADQQPTNVGEEEAPFGVVRVCVCLRVLVVDAMVSGPLVNVILHMQERDCGKRINTKMFPIHLLKYRSYNKYALIQLWVFPSFSNLHIKSQLNQRLSAFSYSYFSTFSSFFILLSQTMPCPIKLFIPYNNFHIELHS